MARTIKEEEAKQVIKKAIIQSYAITVRWKMELMKHYKKDMFGSKDKSELENGDVECLETMKGEIQKHKTILSHLPSMLFFKFPTIERSKPLPTSAHFLARLENGGGGFPISARGWYDYKPRNLRWKDKKIRFDGKDVWDYVIDKDFCMLFYEKFYNKFHTHPNVQHPNNIKSLECFEWMGELV